MSAYTAFYRRCFCQPFETQTMPLFGCKINVQWHPCATGIYICIVIFDADDHQMFAFFVPCFCFLVSCSSPHGLSALRMMLMAVVTANNVFLENWNFYSHKRTNTGTCIHTSSAVLTPWFRPKDSLLPFSFSVFTVQIAKKTKSSKLKSHGQRDNSLIGEFWWPVIMCCKAVWPTTTHSHYEYNNALICARRIYFSSLVLREKYQDKSMRLNCK